MLSKKLPETRVPKPQKKVSEWRHGIQKIYIPKVDQAKDAKLDQQDDVPLLNPSGRLETNEFLILKGKSPIVNSGSRSDLVLLEDIMPKQGSMCDKNVGLDLVEQFKIVKREDIHVSQSHR